MITLWYFCVSIIEIFLLFYFFHRVEKRRESKCIEFSCYFILVIIDLALNYYQLNADYKLIIIFLSLNIILGIQYHINLKRLLFLTTMFLLLFVLSEFIAFTILDVFNEIKDIDLIQTNLLVNIEGTLISRSINLLLLLIAEHMLRIGSSNISASELAITLLPCITNVAVIFFIVDFTDLFNKNRELTEGKLVIFISVMLFLSSVSLLMIFESYLGNKEKQRKAQLMEHQARELMKYNSEKEIVDDRIRKMYHDIKNHILCLEQMVIGSENSKEYIDAIKDTLSGYENYISTGNKALDILMNEKCIRMQILSIKFSCIIDLKKVAFIKDIDVITIFSNAIDNAIEACEKANVDNRYIKVISAYTMHL